MRGKAGRRAGGLLAIFLCVFLMTGCGGKQAEKAVACDGVYTDACLAVNELLLPGYTAVPMGGSFSAALEAGYVCEAFDAQALPLQSTDAALYWYPQYLATVVIAVDRAQTDVRITGWEDLRDIRETVGFLTDNQNGRYVFAAIAHALGTQDGYDTDAATSLLRAVAAQKRLNRGGWDAPVLLLFDYQAAALNKTGRSLEIIIPTEGTITCRRGLLSRTELHFADGAADILLEHGFRLPDGRADGRLYPAAAEYERAAAVDDCDALNAATLRYMRTLNRRIMLTRLYSSADGLEHQMFAVCFLVVVLFWVGLMLRRIAQKYMRDSVFFAGLLIVGWVLVRFVKYQVDSDTLTRYLWYSFYIFQLLLPFTLLRLALLLDNPRPERVKRVMDQRVLPVVVALIAVVFTNDLHGQVFVLDLSRPDWSAVYGYGPLYYVVNAAATLPVLASIFLLIKKAWGSPRRGAFIFPTAFGVLLLAYGYGYIAGIPLASDSDFTMTVAAFFLLYFESAIRSGLVPINTKYKTFFTRSPLRMQIVGTSGETLLASATSAPIGPSAWSKLKKSFGRPLEADENTLLYADPLPCGAVVWQEDVSALNRLHAQLDENARRLAAANALLDKQRDTQHRAETARENAALLSMLQAEINEKTEKLSALVRALPEGTDRGPALGGVTLLLCCIKRRCSLFFREREASLLPADELSVYFDELAEFALYAGVRVAGGGSPDAALRVRCGTLLYDFFYEVLAACGRAGGARVLEQFYAQDGDVCLRLLPSVPLARADVFDEKREAAVADAGGVLSVKALDGDVGLLLRFPAGGAQ
ncbi:MAG: histidine kinase N-terminal 7TM domain-containing protein [Oscillospiraceae bacterium]|nr:histidine kinase N-terminal 7TM domain-containing protein [Oscillospiraceae bacterium]